MRIISLAGVLAASAMLISTPASAAGQPQKPFEAKSWHDGIEHAPCSYFKQNADGSWTLAGTIDIDGVRLTGGTYENTPDTKSLDKRCGGTK